VFRDCENCPDLVVVVPPAGLPAEQVARVKRPADAPPLTAFAIGRFEVTFDDWARCMAGGGCTSQPSDEGWGRNTRPVINVSHEDAVNQYIAWLSRVTGATYRLPSASEWDFAEASGGVVPASGVPLIDSQTICQSGNYVAAAPSSQEAGCGDGFPATAPAGSFKANSLGLSDMRGNVWEWVSDCWTPGFTYKVKDSERDCRKRLLRGGSWTSRALLSSTPARGFEDALRASKSIGFRVARALP
jgi:formylglycine-generating enzyme required for sulfatase activity